MSESGNQGRSGIKKSGNQGRPDIRKYGKYGKYGKNGISGNYGKSGYTGMAGEFGGYDNSGYTGKAGEFSGKKNTSADGRTVHYFSRNPESKSRRETILYALPRKPASENIKSAPDISRNDIMPGYSPERDSATIAFITDSGVFSKRRVDFGTDLLIRSLPPLNGKVLDLGCGYGVAGISLKLLNPCADVWFTDINERAIELCRENYSRIIEPSTPDVGETRIFCSDGFLAAGCEKFDIIVTNPPVRTGKSLLYKFYKDAHGRLGAGGSLYLVIQKKQGMESTYKELSRLFGNCSDIARKAGYHILRAIKYT